MTLPKSCGCPVSHRLFSGAVVTSLSTPYIGAEILVTIFRAAISVTAGEDQTAALPSTQSISPVRSLSTLQSSFSSLYGSWCSGSISPSTLHEHADPESANKFFTYVSVPSGRSGLAEKCRFTSSCSVSRHLGRERYSSQQIDLTTAFVLFLPQWSLVLLVVRPLLRLRRRLESVRLVRAFLFSPLLFLQCRRLASVRLLVFRSRLECGCLVLGSQLGMAHWVWEAVTLRFRKLSLNCLLAGRKND